MVPGSHAGRAFLTARSTAPSRGCDPGDYRGAADARGDMEHLAEGQQPDGDGTMTEIRSKSWAYRA